MPCPNCRCPSCLGTLISSPIPFSPPLLELMKTNRAPINSEVTYSQNTISSLEKMVSLIQARIGGLGRRKVELLGFISKHKAAISPLRSFPPELLTEIFSQYVAMVHNRPSKQSPPLMLMGICSRWRRIVMDNPRLWTKIISAHPMIDSWVTLSKEHPLHLELNLTSPDSYPVLDALIPHSHRWEHVDLCLEPDSIPALARVRACLPSLKTLNLRFGKTAGTVDFCEVAPQLTEIKLTEIHADLPMIVKLPWEQLRVCTLDRSDVVHYVLQHAENLRKLHLTMISEGPWPQMPIEPHSHHLGLGTLVIQWIFVDPDIDITGFLSSITLPSLRTLEVFFHYPSPEYMWSGDSAVHDYNRTDIAPSLAGFFERSCTHLSTLKLTNIPFSPGELIDCLNFSPSLESLDIQFHERWYAINEDLLSSLDVDHSDYILPRLRSLALREPLGMDLEASLDSLITSRRHIDPKHDGVVALLENLILNCNSLELEFRDPRIHRFVSEGLNVTTYGKVWPAHV